MAIVIRPSIIQALQTSSYQAIRVLLIGSCALLMAWIMPSPGDSPIQPQAAAIEAIVTEAEPSAYGLAVYPHPAHGMINIEWAGPEDRLPRAYAIDASGAIAGKFELDLKKRTRQYDLSSWAKGTYTIVLAAGEAEVRKTLLLR